MGPLPASQHAAETHGWQFRHMIEHLHTGFGIVIHLHFSLQEVDFTVDTFHYYALADTLKRQIHMWSQELAFSSAWDRRWHISHVLCQKFSHMQYCKLCSFHLSHQVCKNKKGTFLKRLDTFLWNKFYIAESNQKCSSPFSSWAWAQLINLLSSAYLRGDVKFHA